MEILEKLQKAGLTGNESKVYLELVKKGELSANQIAKNLGIDRTLTYTILNHLIEKGQVSYVIRDNKKFFSIENREDRQYRKNRLSENSQIEKYKSQIL